MWQRKQTVFLALALIVLLLAVYFPIFGISPTSGMGDEKLLFNIGFRGGSELVSWLSVLLVLLAGSFILSLVAIFDFKNMKRQMKLIGGGECAIIIWYIVVAFEVFADYSNIHFQLGIVLPVVALILQILAGRGVKHDENLLKSADRIR